ASPAFTVREAMRRGLVESLGGSASAALRLPADAQRDLESDAVELLRYRRIHGTWHVGRAGVTDKILAGTADSFRPDALWEIVDSLRDQKFLDSTYRQLVVGTALTVTGLSAG